MKQRFSSLDVRVIASELAVALISLRVQNIYDLSSRIFLLKFAKPGKREQLLVDSGFRCHLTSFTRTASTFPAAFVQRLRKYLKSRRVTGVSQIGSDRVIEIVFSEGQYRLYLEFFAAGNIVLTDAEYNVLALLRQVSEGDEDVDVKLGGKYQLETKQNYGGIPSVSEERARDALEKAEQRAKEAQEIGGKKAKRAKGGDDLRKALSAGFPEYPAHLLEHVFTQTNVDPLWKIGEVLGNADRMKQVLQALNAASDVYKSLDEGGERKGYIIAKEKESQVKTENPEAEGTETSRDNLLYDDFHPFRPSQYETRRATHILEFEGFNKTVDEFFSSIESQKLESRLTEREQQAEKKLQSAKDDHAKRLGALQHVQEIHIRKAQSIEANTHRIEEACAAVNGLIGQGMDWVDIGKLIENEQTRGNVVAQMVNLPLKLEENTVTLLLDEETFEEADDDGSQSDHTADEADDSEDDDIANSKAQDTTAAKRLAVDIDLGLSPWQNARQYYDQKKQAQVKEQKTIQASARALKSTERKIQDDLKKNLKQEKAVLRPSRRQFFFEKFLWFISSDGYLVLGGKDAQQNELLYRRYLQKGDIYVHADLEGAAVVVVKNSPETPDAPIPPTTLSQAGALAVCTSKAWDSKAVMAAWWVPAEQVSKTAETGDYLQTGGFAVRGKKNYLPPTQLLLGFGVAWLISEESRANHGKHRVGREPNIEVDNVTGNTSHLNIDDDDTVEIPGNVVPDLEDAADSAEREAEGNAAVVDPADEEDDEHDDVDEDDADDDDRHENENHDNDNNDYYRNPLQAAGGQNEDQDAEAEGQHTERSDEDSDDDDHNNPNDNADDHANSEQTSNDEDTNKDPTTAPSTRPDTPASNITTSTKQKSSQLPRGKSAKARRALKKYADQSDDDRALAMSLLGSNKASAKQEAAKEDEHTRKERMEFDRERRRKQHQRAEERERIRQKAQVTDGTAAAGAANANNVNVEEIDPEVLQQELLDHTAISNLLIPQPYPGDILEAAIPIVAPWSAMSRYKYKVKLQPGNLKKGKAVREIVGSWTALAAKGRKVVDETNMDKERVWAREVDLIRGWRVEEVVGSVPVKGCRVVQGGGFAGASTAGKGGGKAGSGGAKGKSKGGGGGGGGKGGKGR